MSELEDEGVRTILRRLDVLEPVVKKLVEDVAYIGQNGGCWTYIVNGERRGPVLAGQDFSNTVRGIIEDLDRLRKQVGMGRWDPVPELPTGGVEGGTET